MVIAAICFVIWIGGYKTKPVSSDNTMVHSCDKMTTAG
jgi:hypothetical protein